MGHELIAGMMVVHPDDLLTIAAAREVACQDCDFEIGPWMTDVARDYLINQHTIRAEFE